MSKFIKISFFSLVLMLMFGTNVGAASADSNENVSENPPIEVDTEENDDGISTQGTGKPSIVWHIGTGSPLKFSGSASKSALYTNYLFTGESKMAIEVHNKGSKTLTYRLYKSGQSSPVETFTLAAGKSQYSPRNLSASAKYYIKFDAPSNFSGTVTKWN